MFTYIGKAFCEDEDEARVIVLSLSSIPNTTVAQDGLDILVEYTPTEQTSNSEEQRSIIQIENVLSIAKRHTYTVAKT